MKQIKYLLLFAAIFMANNVFAQNANQAKACMDKATAKISNLGGFTARFELSRPGAVGRTSGTISVKGIKLWLRPHRQQYGLTVQHSGHT